MRWSKADGREGGAEVGVVGGEGEAGGCVRGEGVHGSLGAVGEEARGGRGRRWGGGDRAMEA